MALSVEKKAEIVAEYARGEGDTGSPEVQVALLTHNIVGLQSHFKGHIHDHHSRRGLIRMRSKSTRLNSSHITISYAVFCLKKKTIEEKPGKRPKSRNQPV